MAIPAMHIDRVEVNICRGIMALQIASPAVVSKVERLAKQTGLSKTALVQRAVDQMLIATEPATRQGARLEALLAQLDRIPERSDAADPLAWDAHGLPK
jgi:antitoxin VapB